MLQLSGTNVEKRRVGRQGILCSSSQHSIPSLLDWQCFPLPHPHTPFPFLSPRRGGVSQNIIFLLAFFHSVRFKKG
jgi:hypothetical protein